MCAVQVLWDSPIDEGRLSKRRAALERLGCERVKTFSICAFQQTVHEARTFVMMVKFVSRSKPFC